MSSLTVVELRTKKKNKSQRFIWKKKAQSSEEKWGFSGILMLRFYLCCFKLNRWWYPREYFLCCSIIMLSQAGNTGVTHTPNQNNKTKKKKEGEKMRKRWGRRRRMDTHECARALDFGYCKTAWVNDIFIAPCINIHIFFFNIARLNV